MSKFGDRQYRSSRRSPARLRRSSLAAVILFISMCVQALAQTAPGTTHALWSSVPFGSSSAANTSITGDGTDLWIAMEHLEEPTSVQPGLSIFSVPNPWSSFLMKSLQTYGELTDDGIYPSIVTWPGAAQVWVTAKEDQLQAEAHLRVYRQNRSDFNRPATYTAVTGATTGMNHARPFLSHEGVIDEHYLCWTRKNATAEDVWSKPKDAGNWVDSTNRAVSATSDIEDHCMHAFFPTGARYLVYHRNRLNDDEIYLKITTWDGTTWTNVSNFALDGSVGADFPSIWIYTANGVSTVYIAAKSASDDVLYWKCSGTQAQCDSRTEFGLAATILTGGDHHDPKIFVVPRQRSLSIEGSGGSGKVPSPIVSSSSPSSLSVTASNTNSTSLLMHDEFILYQKKRNSPQVKLASKCGGTGTWVEEGWLPMPTNLAYDTHRHQELGANKSSANPSIYWDGTYFHIPFLARHNSGIEQSKDGKSYYQLDLLHYYGNPSDFCP